MSPSPTTFDSSAVIRSSNINEVIKAVLNSFYEKILHTLKALKALKALKELKALNGTKTLR